MSNFDVKNIWKIVKSIKSELSFDIECRLGPEHLLYDDKVPQENLLLDHLGIKSTELRFERIGEENLRTAAEIFIYLNTCPESLKSWFLFYQDLFYNQSPNQIILTLNRMMKSKRTSETENFLNIAETVFKEASTLLSLKYEEIQSLNPGTRKINLKKNHEKIEFLETGFIQFLHYYTIISKIFFLFFRHDHCKSSSSYFGQLQPNISFSFDTLL